jgi:FKBP-type peptidyl-prolyl cis-trans isomerase 2
MLYKGGGKRMKAQPGKYVVFEYTLELDTGEVISSNESSPPLGFVVGQGHMFPSVERQIIDMNPGEKATIFLKPHEAFGVYNPKNVGEIPRKHFPDHMELRPTMAYQAESPEGTTTFVIQAVDDNRVLVDFNHPLAGRRIVCKVKIHEVRNLSESEKKLVSVRAPKKQKVRKKHGLGPFNLFPDGILQA